MSRIAFVAGSNGPKWDAELRFAEQDAIRVAQCLKVHCGFDVVAAPPTGDAHDVMRELDQRVASCRPGDDLIVYFSGHGALVGGRRFLLWGTTSEKIYDSALSARHIMDSMEFSAAARKLLVLDCCHAGSAVGFKGGDLEPLLGEGDSLLVLCASDRLECAREIDELNGGFLTHHLCSIVEEPSRPFIFLDELVKILRDRADQQNTTKPSRPVPKPFLFGKQTAPLMIKKWNGPAPIRVQFHQLVKPDMKVLRDTLKPYLRWHKDQIIADLPISVTLPQEFTDRIAVLDRYLSTNRWPCELPQSTKQAVKLTVMHLLPSLVEDLKEVISVMTVAAISLDGGSLDHARDTVLGAYIHARVFAVLRVLLERFRTEPLESWARDFMTLSNQLSNRLIDGLTVALQCEHQWTFWTDAEWRTDVGCLSIYIPQTFGQGIRDLAGFNHELYWQILFPQILEQKYRANFSVDQLHELLKANPADALARIDIRGRMFIETESHDSGKYAKVRATRLVAEHIARRLNNVPIIRRTSALMSLLPDVLDADEVRKRVLGLVPDPSAPRWTRAERNRKI